MKWYLYPFPFVLIAISSKGQLLASEVFPL